MDFGGAGPEAVWSIDCLTFFSSASSHVHQRIVLVGMAAQRVGRRVNKVCSGPQSPGQSLQRRQARVTVKYNRKELQRRLDVEKWIDCGLDELYRGRVSSSACCMPAPAVLEVLLLQSHHLVRVVDSRV